jgi:hypothetical protein
MKQEEKEGLDFRAEMRAIGARLVTNKKALIVVSVFAIIFFAFLLWALSNEKR